MAKILITGALGTLGTPLFKELENRGHDVWGCDLRHNENERIIRADVSDYRQITDVFCDVEPEYVYHLAAEFGRLNGEFWYEQLWRTNAIGTRNILEACHTTTNAKLIFASSSEIYGEYPYEILNETIPDNDPLYHPNEYALSKWVNEVQIRNFAERIKSQEYVVCRFFNAYGPGEWYHPYRSVVALFTYKLLKGQMITVYSNYWRTFMYINDFIPTLANVCENFNNRMTYNIGGTDYRAVEDVSTLICQAAGIKNPNIRYLEQEFHNVVSKKPDISLAVKELNHNPSIPLEIGVPMTVNWQRDVYNFDNGF